MGIYMRQEKTVQMIELARHLANSHLGLTLDEMAQKVEVGRRTVERMRDCLMELFPNMEEVPDPPTKRWRIVGKFDSFLNAPTPQELAAFKSAQEHLRLSNTGIADNLESLEKKMMTSLGPKISRLAPDIEALMQAEAIAVNQGPRPMVDPFILNTIRDAILQLNLMSFNYSSSSKTDKERVVNPYGIIFGGEAYLIAHEVGKKATHPKMWRLDRISSPKVLPEAGGPPEDFSLKQFAEKSFGVFQETVSYNVILRVFPEHRDEAYRWVFHPNQKISETPSGELLIEMQGSGLRELAWSLIRWGGKLEVLAPQELKDEIKGALKAAKGLIGKSK